MNSMMKISEIKMKTYWQGSSYLIQVKSKNQVNDESTKFKIEIILQL